MPLNKRTLNFGFPLLNVNKEVLSSYPESIESGRQARERVSLHLIKAPQITSEQIHSMSAVVTGCIPSTTKTVGMVVPLLFTSVSSVTLSASSLFPGSMMPTLWSTALRPQREPGWAERCRVFSSPGTALEGENATNTWHTHQIPLLQV